MQLPGVNKLILILSLRLLLIFWKWVHGSCVWTFDSLSDTCKLQLFIHFYNGHAHGYGHGHGRKSSVGSHLLSSNWHFHPLLYWNPLWYGCRHLSKKKKKLPEEREEFLMCFESSFILEYLEFSQKKAKKLDFCQNDFKCSWTTSK